jgi:hypothetical protein
LSKEYRSLRSSLCSFLHSLVFPCWWWSCLLQKFEGVLQSLFWLVPTKMWHIRCCRRGV